MQDCHDFHKFLVNVLKTFPICCCSRPTAEFHTTEDGKFYALACTLHMHNLYIKVENYVKL